MCVVCMWFTFVCFTCVCFKWVVYLCVLPVCDYPLCVLHVFYMCVIYPCVLPLCVFYICVFYTCMFYCVYILHLLTGFSHFSSQLLVFLVFTLDSMIWWLLRVSVLFLTEAGDGRGWQLRDVCSSISGHAAGEDQWGGLHREALWCKFFFGILWFHSQLKANSWIAGLLQIKVILNCEIWASDLRSRSARLEL